MFYRTVLYGRVSFRVARMFLVSTLVVSMVVPALRIPVWATEPVTIPYITAAPVDETFVPVVAVPESQVDWLGVGLWSVYGIGVMAVLGTMVWQAFAIRRMRRGGVRRTDDSRLVVSSRVGAPFSFFGTIYVPETTTGEEMGRIVTHEQSHVRHRHSVERVGMQLLVAVVWWNPAAWWMLRLLTEVHEFEADSDVLRSGLSVDDYLPLIFRQVFGVIPEISVGLAHSLTKKRFEMMRKNLKHSRLSATRVLGVVPLVAGALMLFGFTDKAPEMVYETPTVEPEVVERVIVADVDGLAGEVVNVVKSDDIEVVERVSVDETVEIAIEQQPQSDEPSAMVEVMPKFEGGDIVSFRNWVLSRVVYPAEAVEKDIQGKVVLKFVIERDGSLTNVEVLASPDELLAREAVRVVSDSPRWTPGTIKGDPARVFYVLPVDFVLKGDGDLDMPPAVTEGFEIPQTGEQVLYVVDGRKVKSIDDLDVGDVESIAVLKDEAAKKKYGRAAKDGVILITTKKKSVDVGYGRQQKDKVTTSVSEVEMDNSYAYSDLKQYMQGRVAGVTFMGDELIIRGIGSINSKVEALIVVDGMPMESFKDVNASINPADVASITVLKDAGSTAIYGVRGANGVVLINTKRGGN